MRCTLREWRLSDAKDLANALSNKNILNNLRDGLPYPYTEKDAKDYINAMLAKKTLSKTEKFSIWRFMRLQKNR